MKCISPRFQNTFTYDDDEMVVARSAEKCRLNSKETESDERNGKR